MGMVRYEATFEGSAPDLARIADKASELSGLLVKVTQGPHEDDLIAMRGELAFEVAPGEAIELYTYVPGAVKKWTEGDGRGLVIPPMRDCVQGYNEVPGRQTVYLDWYVDQEPTLSLFILRALEELGGQLAQPLSEESLALCDKPVALAELERRGQKRARNVRIGRFVCGLFLPFSVLLVGFSILLLPFKLTRRRINQAVECAHEASGEPGKPDYIGRLKYAFMMLWALGATALIVCMPLYLVYRAVAYVYGSLAGHGST